MSTRSSRLVTVALVSLSTSLAAGSAVAQSGGALMQGQDEFIQKHRSNQTHSRMQTVPMPEQRSAITPAEVDDTAKPERTAGVVRSSRVPIGLDNMRGPGAEQRRDELRGCRGTVAMQRKVPSRRIEAGRVELRFDLLPDGSVSGLEVVSLSPTDPDVLSCVKRRIAEWRFPPGDSPAATAVSERISLAR